MGTNIRIDVTKQDIRQGLPGSSKYCPVARACKRTGLRNVEVDAMVKCVGPTGRTRLFNFPLKVSEFIERFDRREKVQPFSFTLTS